jgi:hypothetical protein
VFLDVKQMLIILKGTVFRFLQVRVLFLQEHLSIEDAVIYIRVLIVWLLWFCRMQVDREYRF